VSRPHAFEKVLRIVPATLRGRVCSVSVPLPKNPNPTAGGYYVADVFVHKLDGTVHAIHREVLGKNSS
jgi:uncharacterized membrane protein